MPFSDKLNTNYILKWTESVSSINYGAFREGEQLVNHIPNNKVVSHKKGLLKHLRSLESEREIGLDSFLPATHCFDAVIERLEWAKEAKAHPEKMWICKPSACNQGKGIRVFSNAEVATLIAEIENDVRSSELAKIDIVQAYISRPLLLQKRKFDLRTYMLVANTTPYLVLAHPEFYARLSCEDYTTDEARRDDRFVHLTNVAVQRTHPDYSRQRDDIVWSRERLTEHLEGDLVPAGYVEQTLWPRIKGVLKHVFEAARPHFERKLGYFDLFGIDLLLDEDLNPWLLELNTNPAMWTSCEVTRELCPKVIAATLGLALSSFEVARASDKVRATPGDGADFDLQGFEILCDDSEGLC